jgi:hypothetical protein
MAEASVASVILPFSKTMALLAMTVPLPTWAVAPKIRMADFCAGAGTGDWANVPKTPVKTAANNKNGVFKARKNVAVCFI